MKTSELIGTLLDYWVGKALGWTFVDDQFIFGKPRDLHIYDARVKWSPSTDWSQGGPVMERYNIGAYHHESGDWVATMLGMGMIPCGSGPTILIAAMRAYVYLVCGEEVPAEAAE